jgi:hypothetical protein
MNNNNICKLNKAVDCTEQKCENCGWNPDVAEKRIDELVKNGIYTKKVQNEALD